MEFPNVLINEVWEKAKAVPNNPDSFRQDYAGAWIKRNEYNRNTDFGWKIVTIKPVDNGGSETDLSNLFPFHWKNAVEKGKNYPEWTSILSSDGVLNKEIRENWIFNE